MSFFVSVLAGDGLGLQLVVHLLLTLAQWLLGGILTIVVSGALVALVRHEVLAESAARAETAEVDA